MDIFKSILVKYTEIAHCRQQVSVWKQFFTSNCVVVNQLQYMKKITTIKYMRAQTICHITPAKKCFKNREEKLPESRDMFLNTGR